MHTTQKAITLYHSPSKQNRRIQTPQPPLRYFDLIWLDLIWTGPDCPGFWTSILILTISWHFMYNLKKIFKLFFDCLCPGIPFQNPVLEYLYCHIPMYMQGKVNTWNSFWQRLANHPSTSSIFPPSFYDLILLHLLLYNRQYGRSAHLERILALLYVIMGVLQSLQAYQISLIKSPPIFLIPWFQLCLKALTYCSKQKVVGRPKSFWWYPLWRLWKHSIYPKFPSLEVHPSWVNQRVN